MHVSDSPVLIDLLARLRGAVLTEAVVRTRFRLDGTAHVHCLGTRHTGTPHAWAGTALLPTAALQHAVARLSGGATYALVPAGGHCLPNVAVVRVVSSLRTA